MNKEVWEVGDALGISGAEKVEAEFRRRRIAAGLATVNGIDADAVGFSELRARRRSSRIVAALGILGLGIMLAGAAAVLYGLK